MTGNDWLTVIVLAGVGVLAIVIDQLRRMDERSHRREIDEAEDRQLRREARRQP